MSYLLDTNVLSELCRKLPDVHVTAWLAQRPPSTLHLSVLTLGEIRKGIEGAIGRARQQVLVDWLETDLPDYFRGRIIPIDATVADRWGRLVAAAGRPLPAIDSLLAATALTHDLVLVTRNVKDFQGLGLKVFSPWSP